MQSYSQKLRNISPNKIVSIKSQKLNCFQSSFCKNEQKKRNYFPPTIQNKIKRNHKQLSSLIENCDLELYQKTILKKSPITKSTLKNSTNILDKNQLEQKVQLILKKFRHTINPNIKKMQQIDYSSKTNNTQRIYKDDFDLTIIQSENSSQGFNNSQTPNFKKASQSNLILEVADRIQYNKTDQSEQKYLKHQKQTLSAAQSISCLNKSFLGNSFSTTQNEISIAHFALLKTLGQGSYGKVGLYKHKQLKFICAIKQIQKSKISQQAIQYIIRQIKIQTFLKHPNIVDIYTYFQDTQFIYIVMQPCTQGNIYSQLIKKGKFAQAELKKLMKQLCSALNYMHDLDIMHRDIKPENILVHEGVYKICDFGWAIQIPLSRGTLCGTAIYSSPQLIKQSQYDSKIDIWNLGLMAYELVVGSLPFKIKRKEDLKKVLIQDVKFPQDIQISNKCKNFILKCLQKDPRKRCEIKQLVDHEFLQ